MKWFTAVSLQLIYDSNVEAYLCIMQLKNKRNETRTKHKLKVDWGYNHLH